MNDQTIYLIITLPKNGFGIYKYLFEHRDIEAFLEPENRTLIEEAFYKSTGVSKELEPIIDIERTGFISFSRAK